MKKDQWGVLWIALSLNLLMFVVEFSGGIFANSLSLSGDSLDMLGDAIAYGSSLYVINRGLKAKAWSASLKGWIMIISAFGVLGQAIWKLLNLGQPQVEVMAVLTFIALIVNLICLFLLTRHRNDDINMRSVWVCSRNDLIANSCVLIAAGLVSLTQSPWPDILVGFGITVLFLRSGISVLKQARQPIAESLPLGS